MATISSHILNAVHGTHAGGVRVDCVRLDQQGNRRAVFSVTSKEDGRITEEFVVSNNSTDSDQQHNEYELVFHTGEYFEQQGLPEPARIMPSVVFRFHLPDPDARFHIPVVASPHGYSTWWSQ